MCEGKKVGNKNVFQLLVDRSCTKATDTARQIDKLEHLHKPSIQRWSSRHGGAEVCMWTIRL